MLETVAQFIAGIVDGRDPDLGAHQKRLGQRAMAFAKFIGCPARDAELLSIGARIHDLGKLSISEHILNKPARLTAVEFSLVKQHTEIGHRLLAPLRLDPRITEIVRSHHENIDGSGYPDGLVGTAIPRFARMVRILDSHDALTNDRPYHRGVSSAEARRIMQADSQIYDSALLDAFCTMLAGDRPIMRSGAQRASSMPG